MSLPRKPLQLSDVIAELGESPLWDPRSECLFWLDIEGRKLLRLDLVSGATREIGLPARISAIGLARPYGLIAVGEPGYALLDPGTGSLTPVKPPPWCGQSEISNDGKCDPLGRFWSGTKDTEGGLQYGALYRLDLDGSVTRVAGGFGNVNGLDWSPDNRFMYVTDTRRGTIYRYAFDINSGGLGHCVPFVRVPVQWGRPDGLAVDSDGFLWSAHWEGGCMTRYAPNGRVSDTVRLPVSRPTSCAFGGHSMDRLFITTAREGVEAGSGALFCIEGVAGGQPPRWFSPDRDERCLAG